MGRLGFNIRVQQYQNQNNHPEFEQGANFVLPTSTIPAQHFYDHFQTLRVSIVCVANTREISQINTFHLDFKDSAEERLMIIVFDRNM